MRRLPRALLACLASAVVWGGLAGSGTRAADQKPETGQAGPAGAEFHRVFAQFKELLNQMRQVRQQFRDADPGEQPAIESRYNQLVEKGNGLEAQLEEAAVAAYREDPRADPTILHFLAGMITWNCARDNYEKAWKFSQVLLEQGVEDNAFYAWAGMAAFAVMELDAAQQYLQRADRAGVLRSTLQTLGDHLFKDLAIDYHQLLPYYREAWPREQALRAAEAKADDLPRVLLRTSKGDIVLELFENEAPNTVANFIHLVEKKFYDGLTFHRVLAGFMAQGGCPKGDGTGGPGYLIPCECYRPDHRLHFRGSLSMAHRGRDTGGSQFFITFVPTPLLDGRHTVFGRVIQGMEVLSDIQRRDPQSADPPDPDKILQAKVLRKRDHPYLPQKAGS